MKLLKQRRKRTLKEALNDAPYVEEAELEDVLLKVFVDWMTGFAAGESFDDFVESVSDRLGLTPSMLWAAIEEMKNR